jgi:hypothetical protein
MIKTRDPTSGCWSITFPKVRLLTVNVTKVQNLANKEGVKND